MCIAKRYHLWTLFPPRGRLGFSRIPRLTYPKEITTMNKRLPEENLLKSNLSDEHSQPVEKLRRIKVAKVTIVNPHVKKLLKRDAASKVDPLQAFDSFNSFSAWTKS
jgi:hypothetical protein